MKLPGAVHPAKRGPFWPWLLIAALLALHFGSFHAATRPIVTDVRYSLYYAWRVLEGDVPHRDLYALKTQLAVFLGAGLQALGDRLSIDRLLAVRVGYLGVAALGGALLFAIQRRLGRGNISAGLLGLAAYLSFGLLGELPSIGNVSKLAMAVLASVAALCLHSRRWFAAGAASGLAFLDWQVGGLVVIASATSALTLGRQRGPALGRVVLGAVVGALPMLGFYTLHGGFSAFVDQIGVDALARGAAAQAAGDLPGLLRIWNSLPLVCPEQEWLFAAGLAGLPLLLGRLLRSADRDLRPLLLPLAIYHVGVLAFCALDIQGYGDYFLLLHSVAFLLGITWNAIAELTTDRPGQRFSALLGLDAVRVRTGLQVVLVVAALLAARPGPMRPEIVLRAPHVTPGATLIDQRQVAAAVGRRVGDGRLVALENIELLFLSQRENLLPTAYFNDAVWRRWRRGDETRVATALRMIEGARADAFTLPARFMRHGPPQVPGFWPRVFRAPSGHYAVTVYVRRPTESADSH